MTSQFTCKIENRKLLQSPVLTATFKLQWNQDIHTHLAQLSICTKYVYTYPNVVRRQANRRIADLASLGLLFSCLFPKTTNIQTKTFLLAIFCLCNVPSFVKTWSKLIFIHYSYRHILKNRHLYSCINLFTTIQFRNQAFAIICWLIATTADLNCCFPFHSYFHVCRHHLATRRMHRGHYPTTLHALLSTYHVLCLFVRPSLFTRTHPTFVPNCTALLTGLLCYSSNTPVKTHNSVMA